MWSYGPQFWLRFFLLSEAKWEIGGGGGMDPKKSTEQVKM